TYVLLQLQDDHPELHSSPTRRSSDLIHTPLRLYQHGERRFALSGTPADCVFFAVGELMSQNPPDLVLSGVNCGANISDSVQYSRSEEHTSELQSRENLVCRLLLEKKK